MSKVAAIDCGTNSIRLLIAEPSASGGLKDLERRLEIVRLGQGVDASGEFHPDALQRTFAAVEEYAELIKKADVEVENVHFVATSALAMSRTGRHFSPASKSGSVCSRT
jgi:exopolyphosphatase/guanosine-5'-triphosphate,3'-diphosphate pyrophosphatase